MYTAGGRYGSITPATRAHLEAVYYYLQQNYGSISNEIRRTESEPTLPIMPPLPQTESKRYLHLGRRRLSLNSLCRASTTQLDHQESMMSVLDEVLRELQELSKKNPISTSSRLNQSS